MHTFKWIWIFICFKAVSQILWASLLCLLGHILPDPLEWGHVLANEVRERIPFQARVFTANISHLALMIKFSLVLPHSVLPVKGLTSSFYISKMCWDPFSDDPSPLTNTSHNSLYHCGLINDRRQNACVQLIIINSECLLTYVRIIPSCFPYLPMPHWNFLYSF